MTQITKKRKREKKESEIMKKESVREGKYINKEEKKERRNYRERTIRIKSKRIERLAEKRRKWRK